MQSRWALPIRLPALPLAQTPDEPDADLRSELRGYSRKHPRHGFRRAWAGLRYDRGVEVNKKKVHRLWKEEGLQVRRAPRRKRAGQSSVPIVDADVPNVVWALDFQFDSTVDGKAVNAPHLVALVRGGALFHKGKLLERPVEITPEPSPDTAETEVA